MGKKTKKTTQISPKDIVLGEIKKMKKSISAMRDKSLEDIYKDFELNYLAVEQKENPDYDEFTQYRRAWREFKLDNKSKMVSRREIQQVKRLIEEHERGETK